MKFNFYSLALCFLSLFVACTQTESKPKAISKPLSVKDLEGSWINMSYLEDLAKTHSPRQSFAQSGEISQLNFSLEDLKGDTLKGELSYHGHEGGQYLVVLKAGKQPNSFRFGEYSNDFQDAPSDLTIENGILTITHQEPNNGERVKAPFRFRRISNKPESLDNGAGIAVVQTIFLGNWMLTPAKGEAEIIVIDSIGKMYGNINYTKLSIPTDYTGPEVTQDDALVFDKTKKQPLPLHFKFKGTEIDFMEMKGGKETVVFNLSRFMK